MSVRSLIRAWNEFFFEPRSPTPICLFRVLYGLLALADLILLRPDWLAWFGTRGIFTLDTMRKFEPGPRINVFALMPNDSWIQLFFWFALASALFVTIGFATRLSTVALFVCLTSMDQRALLAMHSGDTLLRITGFWMMFAPAGSAFSVDRLLRLWKGKEGVEIQPQPPWAQRMIQFQLAIAYLTTFWAKSQGSNWINGTAIYYVYHLDQFQRFPVPSFLQDPVIVKLETWFTLAIEFALGVLIWFKELRYPLLAIGVMLHLTLEYTMNVPLFQWIMLATYVTFIEPADLARAWNWIRMRLVPLGGPAITVVYDGESERVLRTVNVLRVLDVPGRLRFVDRRHDVPERGRKVQPRLVLSTPGDALEALGWLLRPLKRALSAAPAAK